MRRFQYQGKVYANINGKDFFLLRCYELRGAPILFQVWGPTPLYESDWDGRSRYDLIRTKTQEGIVVTVFAKEYFAYRGEPPSPELCFIGKTSAGSYFLALKFLAATFDLPVTTEEIMAALPEAQKRSEFFRLEDQGNSGQVAVKIRVGPGYGSVTLEELWPLFQKGPALSEPTPAPLA